MADTPDTSDSSALPARLDGDDDYVLEEQIGHLLRRAHQRATSIFSEMIDDRKLTPTQYAALVKIYDRGEVTQNLLGRLTAMDPATIKGVIERLRERGVVESRTDPANKRRLLLFLTDAGSALAEASIPNGQDITDATLAPLTPEEKRQFIDFLKRII